MGTNDAPSTSPTLLGQLWDLNNQQAWARFLEQYQPTIYRWALRWRLQAADAEDVTGRVLARLITAMTTFRYDPTQRFRARLKTVVNNAVQDFLRDLGRRPGARGSGDSDVQQCLEQIESPTDTLVQELHDSFQAKMNEAEQIMERVRQRVTPENWQIFWLTTVEGRPSQEVAAQFGKSVAAVYMAKNRIVKMLQAEGDKLRGQPPSSPHRNPSPQEGEGPEMLEQLKKDTDFDSLRPRADFQKFLADLEKTKATKQPPGNPPPTSAPRPEPARRAPAPS
jgi:RNA polymerase sigma-70 factor (ECF subfamily)